jgi:hypothetical protein
MDRTLTQEYRAHLELAEGVTHKPVICELGSSDIDVLKDRINILLNGKAKFEGTQRTGTAPPILLVFHPNFQKGETPLGWIAPVELPESMSTANTIERLVEDVAA